MVAVLREDAVRGRGPNNDRKNEVFSLFAPPATRIARLDRFNVRTAATRFAELAVRAAVLFTAVDALFAVELAGSAAGGAIAEG